MFEGRSSGGDPTPRALTRGTTAPLQGTGRDTWEVQSEPSVTQNTQQAQATFANNGNFFKPPFPAFPPPQQQLQQQNPNNHPVMPNLPASHPSQQASWVRPLAPHRSPPHLPPSALRSAHRSHNEGVACSPPRFA
jgi:hypothetical protein